MNLEISTGFDLAKWIADNPAATIVIGGCCLWFSVSLIVRMWFVHRQASFAKKFLWSFALLIPLFGWLFYAGCFQIPERSNCPCPESSAGE